jgi:putative ABC transport system ATP-binding protein
LTTPLLVTLRGVTKSQGSGPARIDVLGGLDLAVDRHEVVALLGPSGSGKSSLLHLLCDWERPDGGSIEWAAELAVVAARARQLSVVPQGLGLLDELSVRENVELPLRIAGTAPAGVDLDVLLDDLGLAHLADRRPSECSVGEQQRTAVARAVAASPRLLLADEPTSNQDERSATLVLDQLVRCAERGAGCLVATHSAEVAAAADRVVELRDGRAAPHRS